MDGQWIRVVHSWLKLHGARAVESDLGIRSNSAVECRGHVHGPRECQVNVILKIIKRPDLTRLDITFYHYFWFGFGFGLGFCLEMFSYISWGGAGRQWNCATESLPFFSFSLFHIARKTAVRLPFSTKKSQHEIRHGQIPKSWSGLHAGALKSNGLSTTRPFQSGFHYVDMRCDDFLCLERSHSKGGMWLCHSVRLIGDPRWS